MAITFGSSASFIDLYVSVAARREDQIDFSMKIDKTRATSSWFKTCWRPHLVLFYGTIVTVNVIGIFVIRGGK
jgi:hypothetical protein